MGAERYDTVILGAGAAGMMCAAHAGARGGRVLVLDHAKAPGEKIRISGGGRCNFTNLHAGPENFLSANPHFCKSALGRYTQWDFIELVGRHGIAWHEKTLGQLFCNGSAREIIAMLLAEMDRAGAELRLSTALEDIERAPEGWRLRLSDGSRIEARRFVIACGGKSIPKMGATGFGLELAARFGLPATETRPALVPLTFGEEAGLKPLAGVSAPARVSGGGARFEEAVLFTHRGLSGPAILQVSSYWREGEAITLDLAPGGGLLEALREKRGREGRKAIATALSEHLPKRLAEHAVARTSLRGNLADQSDAKLRLLVEAVSAWELRPVGTEGYRTAEVMLGGVDTAGLDSRTMEAREVPGLFVIGEAVDVTGWLGGYNFQWAWSSGWAAGTEIAARG
ncbi:MAG: NAD(P)/FAD-dependent oxidoreductase [Pseudomonadota bacterium]